MPNYKFVAMNDKGKKINGSTVAKNPEHLIAKLKDNGIYVTSFSVSTTDTIESSNKKVKFATSVKEVILADFFYQLASMLKSGISVAIALSSMKTRGNKYEYFIKKLYTDVFAGASLSEAIKNQPKHFTAYVYFSIKAGESSGTLDSALRTIADTFTGNKDIKRKIKRACTYPIMVFIFLTAVTIIFPYIINFVMSSTGKPNTAQVTFSTTSTILLIILITGVLLTLFAKNRFVRPIIDYIKIKVPPFRKVSRIIYTSRMAETLASLYSSGLNITEILPISISIVNNSLVEKYFDNAEARILTGEPLSSILGGCPYFDSSLASALAVGEKAGVVVEELSRISVCAKENIDYAIKTALKIAYPFIIGTLILFIIAFAAEALAPMFSTLFKI